MKTVTIRRPPSRRPTLTQRKFLAYMRAADGAWLPDDGVAVTEATLLALEARGYIKVSRGGMPGDGDEPVIHGATLTALGRAAATWGEADLVAAE